MRIAPASLTLTRRAWISGAGALVCAATGAAVAASSKTPVVTILGDSITAGYGLPAAAALPAQLQAALARDGVKAVVLGAGVSGDTVADGLARVDFSVQAGTRLCVVALGGNDLLQGVDPAVTRGDLERIVARLKARGIGVLIAGLSAPPVIGPAYAREFDAVFATVARARGVDLYANLLDGVSGHPGLIQGDGIHPSAAGAAVIAKRLAPAVARALRSGSAR
jgi:acyl-CoA thioesterase-1